MSAFMLLVVFKARVFILFCNDIINININDIATFFYCKSVSTSVAQYHWFCATVSTMKKYRGTQ